VQYDPECPFKYNNFIYKLSLPTSWKPHGVNRQSQNQPGCVPTPTGMHDFILRLNNVDAEKMACDTRIENEVAMISLASAALAHLQPAIVPRIFDWGGSAQEQA
jgi:hypothetical protein